MSYIDYMYDVYKKEKRNKECKYHRLVGLGIAIDCMNAKHSDIVIYNNLIEKYNYFSDLSIKYFNNSLYEEGTNCCKIGSGVYFGIKLISNIYNKRINFYSTYSKRFIIHTIIPERGLTPSI